MSFSGSEFPKGLADFDDESHISKARCGAPRMRGREYESGFAHTDGDDVYAGGVDSYGLRAGDAGQRHLREVDGDQCQPGLGHRPADLRVDDVSARAARAEEG